MVLYVLCVAKLRQKISWQCGKVNFLNTKINISIHNPQNVVLVGFAH